MGRSRSKKKSKHIKRAMMMAALIMTATAMTSACGNTQTSNTTQELAESISEETAVSEMDTTAESSQEVDLSNYTVEYSSRDTNTDWESETQTVIQGMDGQVVVDGTGVTVDGETITITAEGTYVFTGSFLENHVVVNAPDSKIRIVFNGASITSSTEAPISVEDSKKVVVTLADGTANEINDLRSSDVDGESTEETETEVEEVVANAAIYSKEDLTFQGNGSLQVTSANNNGITSKDGLIFMGGTYEITTAGHALTGKDYLIIEDGTYTIDAGKDGMRASNETDAYMGFVKINGGVIDIAVGDDGIHAATLLEISQGTLTISESYEGLEALDIVIHDGNIDITASDDGINVAGGTDTMPQRPGEMPEQTSETETATETNQDYTTGVLRIEGGYIHINADGDGLDSNGSVVQTGGDVIVDGPTNGGNGALDYETSYTMTGGSLLAIGSSAMLQTISDESTIYCVTAYYASTQQAQTDIVISADDNAILNYTSEKTYDSILFASAALTEGTEVSMQSGSEAKTATISAINTLIKSDDTVTNGAVTDGMGGGKMGDGMGGGMRGGKDGSMEGERPAMPDGEREMNGAESGERQAPMENAANESVEKTE